MTKTIDPTSISQKKTKSQKVVFKVSRMVYELDIPAGLRTRLINVGGTKGSYFLDEFPHELFPANSFVRHDAEHYGIVLTPDQVE
jgi:hypothetical protein